MKGLKKMFQTVTKRYVIHVYSAYNFMKENFGYEMCLVLGQALLKMVNIQREDEIRRRKCN